MLTVTDHGLYCAAGDFFIDPWRRVSRAIVTHAHSDHARGGSQAYLCATDCAGVLRARLGKISVQAEPYGRPISVGGVAVSFHPAGHVLGSAQIRLEHRGEVWVVSGDYKLQPDPTCAPFEPVKCHAFLTESTFGLPIYRWPEPQSVLADLRQWWHKNQQDGRTSVLLAYSLGKAQRLLAALDHADGPIFVHEAVHGLLGHYEAAGVRLPSTQVIKADEIKRAQGTAMVITPPATADTAWMRSLGEVSSGSASGWMLLRGTRRWQSADRGFPLSDHADWPGLLSAIRSTGAERILVTHGYSAVLARWLNENGWKAETVSTRFVGDQALPAEQKP